MKQEFVYHALAGGTPRSRQARAVAADPTVAVKEYVAYVAMLSLAVVVALITFAYTANMTVKWLDAVVKPSFLAQSQSVASQPATLAMLSAPVHFKKAD
ncbi:hypothetical protein [Hyphomicrobium sp.]|jgi:hypothetical protein|uniref:hypothetical protein n=1 Tax=Hyphomicrobium sp. TaxID=82 RepID=UPI002B7CA166|nr:hypothetical protein [Hyphomicrobium sp.]HVZ06137.1 hypothetical protein [Hyphomicrobium sp.]